MLGKAVAIKTCVPVIQEARLQQGWIALRTVLTFVVDVHQEKCALRVQRVRQPMVIASNVLRATPRLALVPRVRHVLPANTKIKMAQEQHTVVKIASPASTATKPDKVPSLPAKPALLVVGLPRWVLKSAPELLARPVLWASTTP